MATVLIVAYLIIVVALVAVILLQRSEGGGLGMGSGTASFMSVRGTSNLLTRTTAVLATLFFAVAIGLTILNGSDHTASNIIDKAAAPPLDASGKAGASTSVLDALNAAQADAQKQAGVAPTTLRPLRPERAGRQPGRAERRHPGPGGHYAGAGQRPCSTGCRHASRCCTLFDTRACNDFAGSRDEPGPGCTCDASSGRAKR